MCWWFIIHINITHNMRMFFLKVTLFYLALFICFFAEAQTYAGLSINIGNRLSYSPKSYAFETPTSASGNVLLMVQRKIKNNWIIQYGGGLGFLTSKFQISSIDTLSQPTLYIFSENLALYGKINLLVGRTIKIKKTELMIGLGCGGTYYYSPSPDIYYRFNQIVNNTIGETTFEAEINSPSSSILPFAKISAQLKINFYLTFGLEYTHHFGSMLEGSYEFYHTEKPTTGQISLYPREFSVVLLVRISKKKE